ncbi:hypothetical protein [Blastopirellula marina]|uniref:Uncharacterized protein n=1 Tax=Blastopirellula marina TaxID=124 RepID=A0A2S8GQ43_9BACT|nr:hypothetical protein [Blastopirellula marina]PQO46558.1 hypothetical protein C5Y93_08790 [Blastopirellula marina]
MKRALLLIGPLLALVGAIGLLYHGSSILEILLVLTYNTAATAQPLSQMMQEVELAIVFVYVLTVGLVTAIGALTFPGQPQCVTIIGKLLGCLGGATLIGGGYLSGHAMDHALKGLQVLASSEKAPKPPMLQAIVDAGSEQLQTGIVVYIISVGILLLAGLVGFRRRESTLMGSSIKIAMVLLVVAVIAIAIAGSSAMVWYSVDQTLAMVVDINNPPQPSDLAVQLIQALQVSVVLYSGFGGLGVVAIIAYLFSPNYRRPAAKQEELQEAPG